MGAILGLCYMGGNADASTESPPTYATVPGSNVNSTPSSGAYQAARGGQGGYQAVEPVTGGSGMEALLSLGIPEARAREALEIAGNDITLAMEICGVPSAPQESFEISQLVAMGFSEDQSAKALRENNGELDVALAVLMSSGVAPDGIRLESPGSEGGDQGVSRENLETLVGYGFTEDQSRQALLNSQGDLEIALNTLLNAT